MKAQHERNAQIVAAYKAGARPVDMRIQFNLSRSTIEGILERHLTGERRKPVKRESPHLKAVRELAEQNLTAAQIGARLNIAKEAVRGLARRHGITLALTFDPGWWTDERMATLRRLAGENLTAAEIAKEMGTTLGAVCGKASRFQISIHGKARKAKEREAIVKARRTQAEAQRRAREAAKRAAAPPPRPKPVPAAAMRWGKGVGSKPVAPKIICTPADDVARYSFDALPDGLCKWPVGDPRDRGFGCCGLERAAGDPNYCADHHVRAFTLTPGFKPKTGKQLARSLRRYL